VFFSTTTRRGKINSIVTSTGINRTYSLEKYLGFPIMHGRLQRKDYEFLEEKISQRLANWQHNLLNKAGRMRLVKLVLNFIPNTICRWLGCLNLLVVRLIEWRVTSYGKTPLI
jgi:hypothetical protein